MPLSSPLAFSQPRWICSKNGLSSPFTTMARILSYAEAVPTANVNAVAANNPSANFIVITSSHVQAGDGGARLCKQPGSGRPDGRAIPRCIDRFAERLRPITESSQDDLSYK